MVSVIIIVAFLAGYLVGLLQKGIHIHHTQEELKRDPDHEYNPTTEDQLPPEIKSYMENNKGYLKY